MGSSSKTLATRARTYRAQGQAVERTSHASPPRILIGVARQLNDRMITRDGGTASLTGGSTSCQRMPFHRCLRTADAIYNLIDTSTSSGKACEKYLPLDRTISRYSGLQSALS